MTQVVENHVAALTDHVDKIVLLSGPRASGISKRTLDVVQHGVVDELEYDAVRAPGSSAESLADAIRDRLRELGVSREQSVLHWHNHSLGKNVAQPRAIKELAEDGFQQLLQIHDFAEDYRPDNLCALLEASGANTPGAHADYCYPTNARIHYATLTRYDATVLEALGVAQDVVHVVPNCVAFGEKPPDEKQARRKLIAAAGLPEDARWCLYPVRGIRRKNLGEFLLLSRLLPPGSFAGVTLPPTTEIERKSYERWRRIARDVAPQAIFDAGTFATVSFRENLAASEFVISTSAAEGFGMAFLEPWLARRSVVARRLPAVVSDFEAEGLELDQFYDAVLIPADKTWQDDALKECESAFEDAWRLVPQRFRPAFNGLRDGSGFVDFGRLTPQRQIEVLTRLRSKPEFEASVRELNQDLVNSFSTPPAFDAINQNRELIEDSYSIERAAKRLRSIYQAIFNSSAMVGERSSVKSSVQLVCEGRTFFPCRTESVIHT